MAKQNVKVDHEGGHAHLKGGKAIVSFTPVTKTREMKASVASAAAVADNADGAAVANAGYKPAFNNTCSFWGTNNNFPQEVIDLVGKCGVASGAILRSIAMIYGQGIMPCKIHYENKQEIVEPIDITTIPEVEDFFLGSDIADDYTLEATTDMVWFFNFFPYFILNKGRIKINKLFLTEATNSRFSVMDEKIKAIEKVLVSADWGGNTVGKPIEIPLLSEYDTFNDLKNRKSGYRFAMKSSYPTPGKTYYQKTYWDAVKEAGWIDIAISVPKYMKAVFKNSMNLKYHIRIPDVHWEAKYKDWETKDEVEQLKLIDKELDEMDEFLTGEDNAHKSIISHYKIDRQTGKEIPGWEIQPIEDLIKDGKWIPEASAANNEILFAMLQHPDTAGSGADSKSGASRGNSGSNTREADLIQKALLRSFRDRITKPLYLVKRFNNWDKSIHFRMRDTVLTTLDNNSSGTTTSIS